jgi:general secretion pathway protein D
VSRRRLPLVVALLCAGALAACASSGNLKQAQAADDLQDFDLAVARYAKVVREHPTNRDAVEGLERAKLRASDAHHARGRRLAAQGKYEDAVVELQLASELNPTNAAAEHDLHDMRVALRAQLNKPESGQTSLESLIGRTQELPPAGYELPPTRLAAQVSTGQQATARTVYLMLARLGSLSLTFDPQFRDVPAPVTLQSGVTIRQALDLVAAATNTFYQMTGPGTLVVVPDTPAKRREYADEVVRQFTIQNLDIKETMDALRVVADARYISQISGTNTILVRDTADRVRVMGRFLAAFDKARPEVVVDVEVLEVNRTRLQEYGLQLASPGSPGIDGAADVNKPGGITLQTLRNLTQADVLMTGIPALYYRLLKTDSRTRTLANPHIRITDGVPASANFGQDVPVPSLTITPIAQGGVNVQPQTQFQYRTIGVNIRITPRTHPNDDVTLALNIELSSLGAPGFDGLPTFGKRNVETAIRLKDGETNILAGLIREDERTERQTVPGLGDIPALGTLFGRNHKDAEQTDVVIMLTPHIIRVLDLSEDDLRPLRMPREGSGTSGVGLIDSGAFSPLPVPASTATPQTPQGPQTTPSGPAPAPAPVPAPPPRPGL